MILCEIDEETGERSGRAAVDEEMRLWYCHADGVWRPEETLYPSADKEEILAALQDASDARAIAAYLMDTAAVAKRLGVSRQTVQAYKARGRMPEPAGRIAGGPVWTREQIEAWIAARPGAGHRSDLDDQ